MRLAATHNAHFWREIIRLADRSMATSGSWMPARSKIATASVPCSLSEDMGNVLQGAGVVMGADLL